MQLNRKPSEIASGKWQWLLTHFGVPSKYLINKHGPCPLCNDGKDRFRFDDKEGRGTWYCNQCGNGDGYSMLQRFKGWSFREAVQEVEKVVGVAVAQEIKSTNDEAKKMAAVKRIWTETEPISKGDPAWIYLNRRTGIELIPANLRFHPALPYVEGENVDYFPALVAAVSDANGVGVGVHRIYLTSEGNKAPVEKAKKLMAGKALQGACVRLGCTNDTLGIAEGIETALAASMRFGVNTWAAISAGLMEQWNPPELVRHLIVFGDNDASYTGQAAAYLLAKRMKAKGIDVDVRIPDQVGTDWADGLRTR